MPPRAHAKIAALVARVDRALPGVLTGLWVGGSVALDDHHHGSDVDLVALTTRPLAVAERARLRVRGVDIEWTTTDAGAPGGLAAVTAATVHRHGITIRGPRACDAFADVDHATLATIVRANVSAYWVPWLAAARAGTLGRWTSLHPRRVQWGVFGVPRQIVTLADGRIVSKTTGALYLRDRVDDSWHRIIDEAIRLRRGERSLYTSPWARRRDMLGFLEHAIALASTLA